VIVKAALLFALCNGVYAAANPLETLGRLSLYNTILPGRARLPYGENAAQSYSLSLDNLPALVASHQIARAKAPDEFRVVLLGDSGVWGWFLKNADTLAAQLNGAGHRVGGRRFVVYNLAYPIMALTKDLLILDEVMQHQPDMILWPVTLASFPRHKQLFPPLVQRNPARVRRLITTYGLQLDGHDPSFVEPDGWARTLVGERRALADWLRLQTYGFAWAATGVDQYIPEDIPRRQSDFEADLKWESFTQPTPLTDDDLAFDVLRAGIQRAGGIPVLIVNEPMFISTGRNSAVRYNAFYPHWVYDAYRARLAAVAQGGGWTYLDLWDAIAPDEFTDSPVHLTPAGVAQLAARIGAWLARL
jgi:hypothetical protein